MAIKGDFFKSKMIAGLTELFICDTVVDLFWVMCVFAGWLRRTLNLSIPCHARVAILADPPKRPKSPSLQGALAYKRTQRKMPGHFGARLSTSGRPGTKRSNLNSRYAIDGFLLYCTIFFPGFRKVFFTLQHVIFGIFLPWANNAKPGCKIPIFCLGFLSHPSQAREPFSLRCKTIFHFRWWKETIRHREIEGTGKQNVRLNFSSFYNFFFHPWAS